MTSELRVDNLKGSTTGGSINVLSEGTSVTTNLQQGLGKFWVNFDGTASGAASRDSFNISGMTDNGTGDYTITINNNMANDDYADVMGAEDNDSGNRNFMGKQSSGTKTSGQTKAFSYKGGANDYQDNDEVRVLALGDLA